MSRRVLPYLLGVAVVLPAHGQIVPRPAPAAGRIVAAKGGEQASLVPDPRLRAAVARQDLKPGDTLRTNAAGTLAVLFADQTQVRLGRNTVLVVKAVENGSPSALRLQTGSLWARAPRGQTRLSVETPSATAAVRGTDWALQVDAGTTQIEVFDGAIDFFNDQGRLSVGAGQVARARLGEAPTRIITVNSTEREQMQYYLPAEEVFSFLYPTPRPFRERLAERRRILAIAPDARSAEDWLTYAEGGVGSRPRSEQAEALRRLAQMQLTPAQAARATLLDAYGAAAARDFAGARGRIDRALPALDPDRAAVARYGRYVAAVRADPALAAAIQPPEPEPDRLSSWLGQAFVAAFAGDYAAARSAAEEAARRFPDDAAGPAALAAIAMLLDDRALMEQASGEALRRDPTNPDALEMRASFESGFRYRFEAGRRLYEQALAEAPANATILNGYAQVQSQRSATRATERTFRRAIAENPDDALLRVNHAITLIDENRLAAAKKEIDAALAIDPSFAGAHAINGRYLLQAGKARPAFDEALVGSAGDPAGSSSLLIAAVTYYRRGEYDVAMQQIDAADRLDPAGPTAPLIRAAVALDRRDVDTAITAAREAQRRSVALGGDFVNLSQNSDSGGYIASSFRTLGLNEWGRFYGDRLFEPFDATGYFDRVAAGTADPFLITQTNDEIDSQHSSAGDLFSNLLQGLAIEPLAVASSDRQLQFFNERFVEASFGGGLVASGEELRGSANAGFQAKLFDPMPIAINASATFDSARGPLGSHDDRRNLQGTAYATGEFTPYDKFAVLGTIRRDHLDLPGERGALRDNGSNETRQRQVFGVYSHEFGRKSVLSVGGSFGRSRDATRRSDRIDFLGVPIDTQATIRNHARAATGTISYAANLGRLDINVGGDLVALRQTSRSRIVVTILGDSDVQNAGERARATRDREHLDIRFVPTANLVLQAQVARVEANAGHKLDMRIGAAVQVLPGHWLRAAWFRDTALLGSTFTLKPTRVVGILPNSAPVLDGFRSKTFAARFDSEWGAHLFTSLDYQRQHFDALGFGLPQVVSPAQIDDNYDFGPANLAYLDARLDRLSASADAWLGHGFGLSANYARSWSHLPGVLTMATGRMPFVPRDSARIGVTWTSPKRVTAKASVTYTGSRRYLAYPSLLLPGVDRRLGDFFAANSSVEWESQNRNVVVALSVNNIFDAGYELVPNVPGFGRTATLSATFRF